MNNQAISIVHDYFKDFKVSVDKFPVRIDFENSTYINIEVVKEKLLLVFATNIELDTLKDIAKDLLKKCYCKTQKNYIIKLGMHSSNKVCFITSLSLEQTTLPAINEIMDQLVAIKDSVS